MSGVLFIIATPIGNLDDITLRAINTLREVDLVAAEDTRHTQHLLSHLGLRKNMLSLHEHNERQRIDQILELLSQGQRIALVSDAGTPLISDPGYPLVKAVVDAGLNVVPVPGVSSVMSALSAAGLPTDHFCFHGFLSQKNSERLQSLEALKSQQGTQVLFESTHRILRLLQQIGETLPRASLVIAKEMTKRHEKFIRGNASECLQVFEQDPLLVKGEFVVLLYNDDVEQSQSSLLDIDDLLRQLMQDMSLKKAVSLSVEITGLKKNEVYQKALRLAQK